MDIETEDGMKRLMRDIFGLPMGNPSARPPFRGVWAMLLLLASVALFASCNYGGRYVAHPDVLAQKKKKGPQPEDTFLFKKYYDEGTIKMKNARTATVWSMKGSDLVNVETGRTLAEEMAEVDHEHLLYRLPKRDVPKEVHEGYRNATIIFASIQLLFLVASMIFLSYREKPSRGQTLLFYALISGALLATSYSLFQHIITAGPRGGDSTFWDYLFAPGTYGWLKTIFFWIVFFLLSAANLFGYLATITLSCDWSGRRHFFNAEVFLALLVWFVVYLFSDNELNDYFVLALYGIMAIHFVALLISNFIYRANVLEMLYIYLCFWGCLFPVFWSTFFSVVLIPLLALLFQTAKAVPGMVGDMVSNTLTLGDPESSSGSGSEEKHRAKVSKSQKACEFCGWYDRSSGTCTNSGSGGKKEAHGGDAYSCPYYS